MDNDGGIREQRVAHIAALMRAWKWKRGVTGRELAAEWGVTIDWVERLASEASKRVVAEVTDIAAVSETVGVALAKVLDEAMTETDARAKWPARKIAVDAAKSWAQIVGAMAPQRHEITTDATPARAREIMRQKFGAVTPTEDVDASDPGDAANGAPER